ncbi:MAG: YdcF family protein [Nitrospirae bacterium]|nr:YdcF family protein [Nitrospirota bacterium]
MLKTTLFKMVLLTLFNPLMLFFIGMLFLVFTKKSRKLLTILLTLFFYTFSIPFTSHMISGWWGVADTYKPKEKYDAAVVLAGVVDVEWYIKKDSLFYVPNNYVQTTAQTERLLAGLYFVTSGQANELLLGEWIYTPGNKTEKSGNKTEKSINKTDKSFNEAEESVNEEEKSVNEAEKVRMFLASQGISQNKLVLYAQVSRTLDEARGVKAYVRKTQKKKILLVTSWMHMRRAIAMFRNLDLYPDIFSTNKPRRKLKFAMFVPSLPGFTDMFDCIYELVAYSFYFAKGDLRP